MTISYTLQPIPFWYFSDLTGKPLAGGKLFSQSSINPTQFKPIYQDPAGVNQYPNPILFDETGTVGPLYFKLDTTDPDDLYFLQIFNSSGNLVRQIDQYPISGGGGGGTVNTVQKIENIIVNSSFLNNIVTTKIQPIANNTFISPSAHSGLFFPDMIYLQSGSSNAQDTLSFFSFGVSNPLAPDFASAFYLNYSCSNNPTGEVSKGIRIPIAPYVNTLANQIFTMTFYGRANGGGANQINIQLIQYFGTGGTPSLTQFTNLTPTPITLTSSFALYSLSFSVPSVALKVIGNSNDDGTYFEILLPTSQICDIDIAKPCLYAGSIFPLSLYESVEEIESELETPRTGDIRTSMNLFSNSPAQGGWIPLNDGTIGNSISNATTRAQADCWLLYDLIWSNTVAIDCPIYDNSGNPTAKGINAVTDWNANKQIQLPLSVGKVNANVGPTGYTPTSQSYTAAAATDILTVGSTTGFRTGYPVVISSGTAPVPLVNGITYFAIVISSTTMKLAFSSDAAIAGNAIDLTVDGSGTVTNPPPYQLGHAQGEMVHQQTTSELAAHNHGLTLSGSGTGFALNRGGGGSAFAGSGGLFVGSVSVDVTGSSTPMNNMQPTTFYNMIIKL